MKGSKYINNFLFIFIYSISHYDSFSRRICFFDLDGEKKYSFVLFFFHFFCSSVYSSSTHPIFSCDWVRWMHDITKFHIKNIYCCIFCLISCFFYLLSFYVCLFQFFSGYFVLKFCVFLFSLSLFCLCFLFFSLSLSAAS